MLGEKSMYRSTNNSASRFCFSFVGLLVGICFTVNAFSDIKIYEFPSEQAPVVVQAKILSRFVPFFKREQWYKVGDRITGRVGWLKTVAYNQLNDAQLEHLRKLFPETSSNDSLTNGSVPKEALQQSIESIRRQQQIIRQNEESLIKALQKHSERR